MSMLEWCDQADGIGDFKGTAADMAAHQARKNVNRIDFTGCDIANTRYLISQVAEKEEEIKRLHKLILGQSEIIDKFIVKSNGLSMFVRSDIFGRSNLPRLDEKLWDLYNFQCEVEFGDENESNTSAVPV